VLLPVLGDQYGVVLERGELQLEPNEGVFTVQYYDTVLPLAAHSGFLADVTLTGFQGFGGSSWNATAGLCRANG
jgi:maltooligosyltrehalose synthase